MSNRKCIDKFIVCPTRLSGFEEKMKQTIDLLHNCLGKRRGGGSSGSGKKRRRRTNSVAFLEGESQSESIPTVTESRQIITMSYSFKFTYYKTLEVNIKREFAVVPDPRGRLTHGFDRSWTKFPSETALERGKVIPLGCSSITSTLVATEMSGER